MMIMNQKKENVERKVKNGRQKVMKNEVEKRKKEEKMIVVTKASSLKKMMNVMTRIIVLHVEVEGNVKRKKKRKNLLQVLKQTHQPLMKYALHLT